MQHGISRADCVGGICNKDQIRSLKPKGGSPYCNERHAYWLRVRAPAVGRSGHLHGYPTAGGPVQAQVGPPSSPDISLLRPELQQQWHVGKNMHLGAVKIKPYSHLKVVWECDKCPAGQPHIWTTSVAHRTPGSQCPYCSNRLLCLHNSLATVAPDIAKFWDHSKNMEAPEQVLAGSDSQVHWECPACKYEWKAHVRHRVRARSGCPQCSRSRCEGNRGSQPTFAEAQPAELGEWDHEHNEAEGLYPHKITLGSRKQVHWICFRCPKGQLHRWTATPNDRVGKGSGCRTCFGKQACVCNSLESLFPAVAAEFDVDKNGCGPSEVTAWSQKKVWWRNAKRGSWQQAVAVRTDKRLGTAKV